MSRPDHTKVEAGFFDCRVFRDIGNDWQTQTVRAVLTAGPGSRMSGVQRIQESSLRIALANISDVELRRSLDRLEDVGFFMRDGDWIWIRDKADINLQFAASSRPGELIGGMPRAWSEVADCGSRTIIEAFIGRYGAALRLGLLETQQPAMWGRLVSALDGDDPLAYARMPTGAPAHHAHGHAPARYAPATRPPAMPTGVRQTDRSRQADTRAYAREEPAGDSTSQEDIGPGRPDIPKTSASVGSEPTKVSDATHGADPFEPPRWTAGEEPPRERRVTVDGAIYVERFVGSSRAEWLETVSYRRERNGRLTSHDGVASGYGGAAWVRMMPLTMRVVEVRRVYCEPDKGAAPSWDAEARKRAWAVHPDNADRVTVAADAVAP